MVNVVAGLARPDAVVDEVAGSFHFLGYVMTAGSLVFFEKHLFCWSHFMESMGPSIHRVSRQAAHLNCSWSRVDTFVAILRTWWIGATGYS